MRRWALIHWGEFLRHLQRERNVYRAADLTGIEHSTVYRKRKRDPEFAEAMERARSGRLICEHCGEVVA
ncbi:hypothetical protein DRQ53_15125 [bacterium]|nr:MAG: hypothetical protein DRQ53_15125 [bacterium]